MARPISAYYPDSYGCMPVLCWCEAYTVSVPQSELLAGLTRSCESVKCQELGEVERRRNMVRTRRAKGT